MEVTCYIDLSPRNNKGEFNNTFIKQLREAIKEAFPVKKDFRTNSEKATLTVYYPKGQIKATLFRCLVLDSRTVGNNLIVTYRTQEEVGRHTYNRYYLHEREADIVNGRNYEFILIDNVLLVEEITRADQEMIQDVADADNIDLTEEESVEGQNT